MIVLAVLYFEGVGCECQPGIDGAIHRMRIRSAFKGKTGKPVYIEVMEDRKVLGKKGKHFLYEKEPYASFIVHEGSPVQSEWNGKTSWTWSCADLIREAKLEGVQYKYRYTEEGVLHFLKDIGYEFDGMEVMPDLSGYRAHKDHYRLPDDIPYNLGDEFEPDWGLIKKRQAFEENLYRNDAEAGIRRPCISCWVDQDDPHILHYQNHGRCADRKQIEL